MVGEKSRDKVKSFADAAAFGEVVVLAVEGQVALEALKLVGAKALHGKTVIDATNPIAAGRRSTACCRTSPP